MSLSYASHIDFFDEEHWRGVVRVQTSRCWYRVAIREEGVTVLGPGVDETFDHSDLPKGLSFEASALAAVLLFEEQEQT